MPRPLGRAHAGLAEAAGRLDAEQIEREYFNLFVGVGRGELLPYISYYLTGFLHEYPLARLREDLRETRHRARSTNNPEPEDHIAILCEIMAGLIDGRFAAPPGSDRAFFAKHLNPWAGRLFDEVEKAKSADFYGHVGAIGRLFMQLEREAFELTGVRVPSVPCAGQISSCTASGTRSQFTLSSRFVSRAFR